MRFKWFKDKRGILFPFELNDIPFKVKRFFLVFDVPKNFTRGEHAHYKTKQLLICIKGKIKVMITCKGEKIEKILNCGDSFFVDKKIWDAQQFLQKDSILLVLSDTNYQKSDYITDYNKFKNLK